MNGGSGISKKVGGGSQPTTRTATRFSGRTGVNGAGATESASVSKAGKATRAKPAQTALQPAESTSDALDAERDALLSEKQAQLEGITDRHDDLVRELFQMENFTMMLSYDPQEAKLDNTAVFREYKAKYDLLDHATPTAGPSRQTRRQINERRQILTAPPAALRSTPSPKKKATKKTLNTNEIFGIIASTKKGKAKEKEKEAELDEEPESEPMAVDEPVESISEPVEEESTHVKKSPRKRSTNLPPPSPPPPPLPPADESISTVPLTRQGHKKRRRDPSPVPPLTEPMVVDERPGMKENNIPPQSISVGRRSGRLKDNLSLTQKPLQPITKLKIRPPIRSNTSFETISAPTHSDTPTLSSSPTKPSVKRIKLIVRRPPPSYSSPKQFPPPPKFGLSLPEFLNSYISIGDKEVTQATLDERSTKEAAVRAQVEKFRRQGRFIPGTRRIFSIRADYDSDEEEEEEEEYVPPERTSKDQWDAVIESVVARYKQRRPRPFPSKQGANNVASKIQAHLDGLEAKKVKARDAEERRLRKLAKTTLKYVVDEWKKAVFHIREKQRLEEEAEERRLGHAHLDAILVQTGALLETQQGDLARDLHRSRSRTGSVPDSDDETDEEEDEEVEGGDEDEEGGEEDADVEAGEADDDEQQSEPADEDLNMLATEEQASAPADSDQEEEEEDEEDSSAMLLADHVAHSPPPGTGTPATTTSGLLDAEDGVSTAQLLNGHVDHGQDEEGDVEMRTEASSEVGYHDSIQPNASPEKTIPTKASSRGHEHAEEEEEEEEEGEEEEEEAPNPSSAIQPSESHQTASRSPSRASGPPDSQHEASARDSDDEDEVVAQEEEEEEEEEDATQVTATATLPPPSSAGVDEEEGVVEGVEEVNTEGAVATPEHSDSAERSEQSEEEEEEEELEEIPEYLKPYAVAPVKWDPEAKVTPPLLLRGVLRPYQQSGLEWLASLHVNKLNGILADEMGLGKTIQTIALLAHLACDRGIWGPHLIVVPTSVLLNWEMEFKKFLPGFRTLSYHGSTKRRKELRQGWNDKHHFNVCITSYALASRDAHIFKRKAWYYMILDEAHMIKNFKSQRWNILLMFRSYRRLLLTGTPLQNNLTELWALLQFLMAGSNFANLKEFGDWFSNPLEKAIEMGNILDDETMQRVSNLHTVLRPYLLRRLKRDVEKELPSKFEHLMLCPLSKRQRFLYDEFMSRAQTQDALESGVYQKIANILMQLRKVCNHPDLFEVRPIVTSFTMARSAIADFEIKELLIRRRWLESAEDTVNLDVVNFRFIDRQNTSLLTAVETRRLDATTRLPFYGESAGEPPPKDFRTQDGFRKYYAHVKQTQLIARWAHAAYLNKLRCSRIPICSEECLSVVKQMTTPILPYDNIVDLREYRLDYLENVDRVNKAVKSYATRASETAPLVSRFAFITPPVVALDMPRIALAGHSDIVHSQPLDFDSILHLPSVKLQVAFPEPSLLQYDCGKLQKLAALLREKKAGGHRILIFTQMTRILDILEIFLNLHGYLYLRLDGATKIEDRQYITERFNADPRIFCFISSSRSGGVGINLTGADTVVFYDSDFNPQMDKQCEDRAHRIGQIRDVHIYRFVSQHTVEEAMLRKANQKRSLDDLVIQKGEFDWRTLFKDDSSASAQALTRALGEFEDIEDQQAAMAAAREANSLDGADEDDFEADLPAASAAAAAGGGDANGAGQDEEGAGAEEDEEEGGTVADYMVAFVKEDWDFFGDWSVRT